MSVREFFQEAGLVKNGIHNRPGKERKGIGYIQINGKWLTEKKQRFIIEKDETQALLPIDKGEER